MRKLINYKLLFLSSFFLAACSNEDNIPSILPSNQPDAVELGITAGVTLTKSAVTANTGLTGGIAVYAGIATDESDKTVDPYTSTLKNNYAIYTSSNGTSWATAAGATDKIYLTSQKATIFAYYPAYKPTASGDDKGALLTSGMALKASEIGSKVSASSTIDVSVYQGSTSMTTNNFLNPTTSNASNNNIISAPGEVDYMWGSTDNSNASTQPTTSNGKATGLSSHTGSVDFYMNHALALVSFRIYNDGTYKNAGKLTKIQLKNKSGSGLSDGGAVKMNISTGAITTGSGAAGATYTRFIDTDGSGTPSGYTIASVTSSITEDQAKASSSKFSIMVLPTTTVAANTIQAIFTIDGADYDVVLGSSGNLTWERGKNHLYTVKLSGKGLSVGTVTVAAWGTGTGNDDLKVN